jgi:YbgC/YbaW family acyl-CoA thioester hydrolase
MSQHSLRFRVRLSEIDSFGHVNNAAYWSHLQEAAICALESSGMRMYDAGYVGMVARRLVIQYHRSAAYGAELDVMTRISGMCDAGATSEHLIMRASDRETVARARVRWDLPSHDLPQDEAPQDSDDGEGVTIRLRQSRKTPDSFRYKVRRRVQHYEVGPAQQVSPGVLLNWVEQAYFDALRAAGHPIERTRQEGWLALQGGHEMEFFEPVHGNEYVEIVSWICELGRVRGAWTHEIRRVEDSAPLACEYSLGVFIDDGGKPISPPRGVLEDVLRGRAA